MIEAESPGAVHTHTHTHGYFIKRCKKLIKEDKKEINEKMLHRARDETIYYIKN